MQLHLTVPSFLFSNIPNVTSCLKTSLLRRTSSQTAYADMSSSFSYHSYGTGMAALRAQQWVPRRGSEGPGDSWRNKGTDWWCLGTDWPYRVFITWKEVLGQRRKEESEEGREERKGDRLEKKEVREEERKERRKEGGQEGTFDGLEFLFSHPGDIRAVRLEDYRVL